MFSLRSPGRIAAFGLSVVTSSLLCSAALAQLPTTQFTSIYPPGAKVGAKVEVTIAGDNLDEADQVLFSHPGITAAQKMNEPMAAGMPAKPAANQFNVNVAGDVPPGVYEARVRGRFGLSNPRSFVIGSLEEATEAAGNNEASKAQEIAVGAVVNGRVEQNNRDYYKLSLKAGERVLIECRAGQIDSRLDPAMAVLNAQGSEIARAHDAATSDVAIDLTAPTEGVYTIMLYDFLYGGGADYAYRLAVHKAPLIEFVFPPAGQAGSQAALTVYGRNLPGGQPAGITIGGTQLEKVSVTVPVPANPSQAISTSSLPRTAFVDTFDYRLPSPSGPSNAVAVGIATEPVILEQEPNDAGTAAQKITAPAEIAGQFFPARDRDYFQFDAKKGDIYTIEVIAHRLGLESDPALTIQRITKNDKSEETVNDVAQVDDPQDRQNRIGGDFDTSTDDAAYRLVVAEDSTYRLLVRDNFGESRTDPSSVYRLIVRKEKPDFRLAVYLDPPSAGNNQNLSPLAAPVLRKGGTLELRVAIDRRDNFEGEVTVSVEGLPAGVTCPGAVVGGATNSASLVFTAADSAAAGLAAVKFIGKATIDGQEVARAARVGTCVWGTTNRQQTPPEFRIAQDLVVSVMDKEMQPAMIVVGEDKVYETSRGGNIEIPVKVARRDGFAEAIKLTKANLPNEVQVKELNIAAGAADGKLEIALNQQNIKAGTYTFYLKGETKLKYARNPDAVKALEEEQKQFAEMQKMLQEALNKANADKSATAQAAQQATTERTQAEQAKNTAATQSQQAATAAQQATDALNKAKEDAAKDAANQALAEAVTNAQKKADEAAAAAKTAADKAAETDKAFTAAQEKLKAAEEAKTKAEQAATEAQAKVTMATQQKQQLDQALNKSKQDNQAKDVQLALVSTPVKMRIVESPLKVTLPQAAFTQKQGEKFEVPVNVERLYGFADTVELTVEVPGSASGVSVQKVDLKKEETQGKLAFTLNNEAKVGEHTLNIRARARFNNVQSDITLPVTVKIDAAPAPAK